MQTGLQPPKVRMGVFITLLVIVPADLIISVFYPIEYFVLFGLLLDIIGATLIAVPDIPFFRKYLYCGRLKIAKRSLNVVIGTPVVSSPVPEKSGIYHAQGGITGFEELTEVFSHATGTAHDDEIVAFMWPKDNSASVKIETTSGEILLHPQRVENRISDVIRDLEGRWRLNGILVLVSGFTHQSIIYLPF